MLVPVTLEAKCFAVRYVPAKFWVILERTNVVSVKLDPFRPAALARSIIAADHRSSPLALLVGTIGVPALPVRVVLAIRVASFDAALMRAKPLLPESRYRLIVLDLVWLVAVLANLCANAALPKRAVCTRPVLGTPLSTTLIGAKLIKACSCRGHRLLLLTPLTLDDDGHTPIILQVWPSG